MMDQQNVGLKVTLNATLNQFDNKGGTTKWLKVGRSKSK